MSTAAAIWQRRRVLRVAGARLLDDRDRAGVRAALDSDPAQARRALAAQAVELKRVGEAVKDPRLVQAAEALGTFMGSDLAGPAGRAELVKRIDALMGFMSDEGGRAA